MNTKRKMQEINWGNGGITEIVENVENCENCGSRENCENCGSALADRLIQTNVDFARPRLRKVQKNPEPEKAPD